MDFSNSQHGSFNLTFSDYKRQDGVDENTQHFNAILFNKNT